MPFSPWLILGAVLAAIGAYLLGNVSGHRAERVVWELAIERQKTEAANELTAATARAATVQKANDDLNLRLETQHAANSARLASAMDDLHRTATELDQLRQQPGRWCDCRRPVPPGARATPLPASAAAGVPGVDPGSFSELAEIAKLCVASAEYGSSAHTWAVSIKH